MIEGLLSDGTALVDEEISFSILATGADSYQWESDELGSFAPVAGATSATHSFLSAVPTSFNVRCVVSNAAGSVTSNTASATWTAAE